MSLRLKLNEDLMNAMKAQQTETVGVLRMAKAAVMKFEVSGDAKKEATDEEVLTILAREVKQRKEAADAFRKGAREDLATKEESEIKVLEGYLPTQMSEAEVREAVGRILKEAGATSKADTGKAMAAVMKELKGKADGKVVNQVVGELLK